MKRRTNRITRIMTSLMLCIGAAACERGIFPDGNPEDRPSELPDIPNEAMYVGQCKAKRLDFALPDGTTVESEQAIIHKVTSIPQDHSGRTYIDFIPINAGQGSIVIAKDGDVLARIPFTGILPDILPEKPVYQLDNATREKGVEIGYALQVDGKELPHCNEFEEGKFIEEICRKYLSVKIEPSGMEAVENELIIDGQTNILTCGKEIDKDMQISDAIKFSYRYQDSKDKVSYSSLELNKGKLLPLHIKMVINGNPAELNNVFYENGGTLDMGIHTSPALEDDFVVYNSNGSGPCVFDTSSQEESRYMVSNPKHALLLLKESNCRMFFLSALLQTGDYFLQINGQNTIYDQYIKDKSLDGILLSEYLVEKNIVPVEENGKIKSFLIELDATLKRNPYADQTEWFGPICTALESITKGDEIGVHVKLENVFNKPFSYVLKYKTQTRDYEDRPVPGHPDGEITVPVVRTETHEYKNVVCVSQEKYMFIPAYHETVNKTPAFSVELTIKYGKREKTYTIKE